MRILLLATVAVAGFAAAAHADTIIFNQLGTNRPFNSTRTAGSNYAPFGEVTFAQVTTIDRFGVYDALATAGNQTFMIFNFDTGALLYQSAAKAFAGDGGTDIAKDSYKVSDAFSFTFSPGTTYAVGATSNVSAGYYAASDQVSQNGITVLASNANVSGSTVSEISTPYSTGLIFYTGIPDATAAAATNVPEPWTLALIGTGVAGLAVGRRRFNRG